MSPSSFEKAIRLQFDCLIRKVIDRTVKNYYRVLFGKLNAAFSVRLKRAFRST